MITDRIRRIALWFMAWSVLTSLVLSVASELYNVIAARERPSLILFFGLCSAAFWLFGEITWVCFRQIAVSIKWIRKHKGESSHVSKDGTGSSTGPPRESM